MNDVTASEQTVYRSNVILSAAKNLCILRAAVEVSVPPHLLLPQRQHPQNRLLLSDKLLHTHPRQSDHFS